MRAIKNILNGAVIASLLSTTAIAHTNSIGYVGDGNGGLNFYYGSWHDGTQFNEAELKIIRPDGTTSIDAFNLLEQDSPAGLISGVNFFTSDGTQLVPYDPNTPHPMGMPNESYTWQGVNYQNLVTGQYTFVYIPLGDAESNLPGSPTAEWAPMDEVIRSLTIQLTQGDLNGDANQNGILDINEVASGAASGAPVPPVGPTVVGQGSSQVVGYIAVSGGVIQVISRSQTDTTWDNMSDNTTANVQVTTTSLTDWVGRVDQVTQLTGLNIAHGLGFSQGITGGRTSHTMANGYSAQTDVYSLGHTVSTDNGVSISGVLNFADTSLTGEDSKGTMSTTHVGVEVSKHIDNRDVTVSAAGHVSNSDIAYERTIGDFNAAGSTTASDTWATLTVEKSTGAVRPWAGYTVGKRTTDAWAETGSVQASLTNAGSDESYNYATIGLNVEAGIFDLGVSKAFDDADTMRVSVGIDKNITDRIAIGASANRTIAGDNTSTFLSAGLQIKF